MVEIILLIGIVLLYYTTDPFLNWKEIGYEFIIRFKRNFDTR